jgi:hypothetical protein
MDKDVAELLGYVVGGLLMFFLWRKIRPAKPRAGIFDNRLKDIKKERAEDQDSNPL